MPRNLRNSESAFFFRRAVAQSPRLEPILSIRKTFSDSLDRTHPSLPLPLHLLHRSRRSLHRRARSRTRILHSSFATRYPSVRVFLDLHAFPDFFRLARRSFFRRENSRHRIRRLVRVHFFHWLLARIRCAPPVPSFSRRRRIRRLSLLRRDRCPTFPRAASRLRQFLHQHRRLRRSRLRSVAGWCTYAALRLAPVFHRARRRRFSLDSVLARAHAALLALFSSGKRIRKRTSRGHRGHSCSSFRVGNVSRPLRRKLFFIFSADLAALLSRSRPPVFSRAHGENRCARLRLHGYRWPRQRFRFRSPHRPRP